MLNGREDTMWSNHNEVTDFYAKGGRKKRVMIDKDIVTKLHISIVLENTVRHNVDLLLKVPDLKSFHDRTKPGA